MIVDPRPLLGLVMIVRNEADGIADILRRYAEIIDHYTILDTGSTDGTQEIIRHELSATGIPGHLFEEPFVDFATSRNRVLELHGEATVFTIMSGIDRIVGGPALRTFLEEQRDTTDKAFNIRFAPGRYNLPLVMRTGHGWRYGGRTHEAATGPDLGGLVPDVMIVRDRVARTPEQWRARWERDLVLLAQDLLDNPENARAQFYLAQTLECLELLGDALEAYSKRSTMTGYFDETFEAKFRVARVMAALGRSGQDVDAAYLDAYRFDPRRAEPLYAIAERWHNLGDHALTYLFASRAAELPMPQTDLFVDAEVYEWKAADLVAVHAFYLRDDPSAFAIGRRCAKKALAARPSDERLRKNLAFYV